MGVQLQTARLYALAGLLQLDIPQGQLLLQLPQPAAVRSSGCAVVLPERLRSSSIRLGLAAAALRRGGGRDGVTSINYPRLVGNGCGRGGAPRRADGRERRHANDAREPAAGVGWRIVTVFFGCGHAAFTIKPRSIPIYRPAAGQVCLVTPLL